MTVVFFFDDDDDDDFSFRFGERKLSIFVFTLVFARFRSSSVLSSGRKEREREKERERSVVCVRSERRRRDDAGVAHTHTHTHKERERERFVFGKPPSNTKKRFDMSAAATFRRSSKHVTKHVKEASKHLIKKWKIFTGDRVVVTAGKDKGQIGQVTKVLRKENKLIVSGINLVKKHVKPQPQPGEPSPPGQIISVEQPIHYSNVSLVDPNTGGRVRIQSRFLDDGTKVRVTKGRLSSQTIVPKPDQLLERKTARGTGVGEKDTREDAVREVTYVGPR